jgi:hypothetical protein
VALLLSAYGLIAQYPVWKLIFRGFFLQAELLATCQTNVVCLQTILSQVSRSDGNMDRDLPSIHEFKPVEGELLFHNFYLVMCLLDSNQYLNNWNVQDILYQSLH